jgi:hypothetical protein
VLSSLGDECGNFFTHAGYGRREIIPLKAGWGYAISPFPVSPSPSDLPPAQPYGQRVQVPPQPAPELRDSSTSAAVPLDASTAARANE